MAQQSIAAGEEDSMAISFDCDKCDRSFTSQKGLSMHNTNSHTVRTPRQCDLCDRTFPSKRGLTCHKREHEKGNDRIGLDEKTRKRLQSARFRATAHGKAAIKAYCSSEKGRRQRLANNRKCRSTPAGKAKMATQGVARRSTRHGYLTAMWTTTQASAKRRDLEFDLPHDFFFKIAETQQDKCYYSGMEMVFGALRDFQASPERKDPSRGYTEDNVVLVCLEFNNRAQWTHDKVVRFFIDDIPSISATEIQGNVDAMKCERQPGVKRKHLATRIVDGQTEKQCNKCDQWSSHEECRPCKAIRKRAWDTSARGKMMALLASCARNAKVRGDAGRTGAGVCDITFHVLVDMYISQCGVCAYSGMPLAFSGERMLSVERVDTTGGYTRDNILLICIEFQSVDHSVRGKQNGARCDHEELSSGGWTVDKFQTVKVFINKDEK